MHGGGVDVLGDDRDDVVAEEWRAARHHLVEHRAKRVQVAPCVRALAERLLGRHVCDRPDHHASHARQRAIRAEGKTKVAQLRGAVLCEPDVSGLHIPVDNVPGVGMRERSGDVPRDADRLSERQCGAAALQEQPQIAAGDILADDIRPPLIFTDVVDNDDIGMVQPAHRLRFARQQRKVGCLQHVGLDEGEGAIAFQCAVPHQIDHLLPALTQHGLYGVPACAKAAGGAARQRCREQIP